MFGETCLHACECDKNNTKSCHPWTGKCDCKAGWSSNLCNRPCPFLTYGENCAIECDCNGAQCSPITGECICAPGYQGNFWSSNRTSDPDEITIELYASEIVFVCFIGRNCEKQCDEGFFGDCTQKCNCTNGKCSPETGQCFCAVGWKGINSNYLTQNTLNCSPKKNVLLILGFGL